MSTTFTKLFASITESTIWAEPDAVRIVWITMLAMADRHGRIWASVPGLANRARVSLEACEDALDRFQKPDKYSRTPDHEGRRIEPIDGGWRLLNHAKYRAIRDEEAALEAKRKYASKRRAQEKLEKVEQGRSPSNTVSQSRDNADADADADADAVTPLAPVPGELGFKIESVAAPKPAEAAKAAICELFNRRSSTGWSAKEMAALQTICKMNLAGPDELALMRWYYKESGCTYLRKDVLTLLNNWTGELDRARAAKEQGGLLPAAVEIETLKNKIAYHRANPDWVGYVEEEVTPEMLEEYKKLREKLAASGGSR